MEEDNIFLKNVRFEAVVGLDRWHRPKPQPVLLSVRLPASHEIQRTAMTDNVNDTINYGTVYKALIDGFRGKIHPNIDHLARHVAAILNGTGVLNLRDKPVEVEVRLPAATTLVESGGGAAGSGGHVRGKGLVLWGRIKWDADLDDFWLEERVVALESLALRCIVGVNPHERLEKQTVLVDLQMRGETAIGCDDFPTLISPLVRHVEVSSYSTIEALAVSLADMLMALRGDDDKIDNEGWEGVHVRLTKPHAYAMADGPGVEVNRVRKQAVRSNSGDSMEDIKEEQDRVQPQ